MFVSLHGADPLPQRLQDAGIPVIISGRPLGARVGPSTLAYVDADNVGGARSAVRLLVERGRRRIGSITGPLDMVAARDRYDGFRAELGEHGLERSAVVHADFSISGGRTAMLRLFDLAPDADAVFVANDLMALGALQAAAERGRRVRTWP